MSAFRRTLDGPGKAGHYGETNGQHDMPKITGLDKQWQQLMTLCENESKMREEGNHPRLLKLIASDIEALGAELGFNARRIAGREFRAQRDGDHIVAIITD
jgi:hypothetical protein